MNWRRVSDYSVGDDPPPYRPFFPDFDNFIQLIRTRVTITKNGAPYLDTGWSDWTGLPTYPPLPSDLASANNPDFISSTTVDIDTAGRQRACQIVYEETTTNNTTGATTTALNTYEVDPGGTLSINWTAPSGHSMSGNPMILIPAEG